MPDPPFYDSIPYLFQIPSSCGFDAFTCFIIAPFLVDVFPHCFGVPYFCIELFVCTIARSNSLIVGARTFEDAFGLTGYIFPSRGIAHATSFDN